MANSSSEPNKDILALLREELARRDGVVTIRDIARAADEIERLRKELGGTTICPSCKAEFFAGPGARAGR